MTPIDDLDPGDYIAVFGHVDGSLNDFAGDPLRITAICLPWIAVVNQWQQRMSIDVRSWKVKRISKEFVAAMTYPKGSTPERPIPKKRRKRNRSTCQRCGEKLVQKLLEGKTKAGIIVQSWRMYCEQCDSEQGPAPVKQS